MLRIGHVEWDGGGARVVVTRRGFNVTDRKRSSLATHPWATAFVAVWALWSGAYALSIALRLAQHEHLGLRTWIGAGALLAVWLYLIQRPRLTRRGGGVDRTGRLVRRIAALFLVAATVALDAIHTIGGLLEGGSPPVHSSLSTISLLICLRLLWVDPSWTPDADTTYGPANQARHS
jgi:hypothetical protein